MLKTEEIFPGLEEKILKMAKESTSEGRETLPSSMLNVSCNFKY